MKFRHSLKKRVVVSFFFLTLFLEGTFAFFVFLMIDGLERELFYNHLERNADWLIQSTQQDQTASLPPGSGVYRVEGNQDHDLPDWLKNMKEDRAEVELADEAYFVIVRKVGDVRYFLVQDQTEFEKLEDTVGAVIGIGFIVALAGSLWLGFLTANRVIAPVIELSNRVRQAHPDDSRLGKLSQDFTNDEVGLLAVTITQYARTLQEFLGREKAFTGDVSHELRTPLMVISSSCELLLETKDSDDHRIEIIQRIRRSSKEMQSLVETFLVLSRDSKNTEKNFLDFDATEIASEEVEDIRTAAESHGAKTRLHLNAPPKVRGIPQLFRVALRNLLRNALHHARQGEILVLIDSDSISVEDSGRGIPEEYKNAIFDRHYQVESADATGSGEGLGLSIVKRICDYHGWKIYYEAIHPQGCRFKVVFSLPE